MPTDIAVHACGAMLAAAFISDHAGILECHVKGVCSREANVRRRVGGAAHRDSYSLGTKAGNLEEVGEVGGGVGGATRGVEGTWKCALAEELEVVERVDINGGQGEGGEVSVTRRKEEAKGGRRGVREGGLGVAKEEGAVDGRSTVEPHSADRARVTVFVIPLLLTMGKACGGPYMDEP